MRKRAIRLVAPATVALISLGVLLLGCGGHESAGPAHADGAALYGELCALCHGEHGEGGAVQGAPALANQDFLAAASDEFLFTTIADGRPGTRMSPWGEAHGSPLSDDDVRAVIQFIQEWRTVPRVDVDTITVTGSPERGSEIYAMTCASCHGANGTGGTAPNIGNPGFLAAASDGFIRHTIQHGRRGTAMAAYGNTLTDQQIDDVTAFIRSWEGS